MFRGQTNLVRRKPTMGPFRAGWSALREMMSMRQLPGSEPTIRCLQIKRVTFWATLSVD